MPERPSRPGSHWVALAGLLLVCAAGLYYITWRLLGTVGLPHWLAPIWVGETYVLVGAAFYFTIWQPARDRRPERRSLPRVSAAMPVRYSTEEGQVGIGALVDIHEKGAGLLVPKGALDAARVWMQFLWFDDRIGMQGKVIYTQETPDGLRLGLELQRLHPDTLGLLANYVIPFGQRRFTRVRGIVPAIQMLVSLWKRHMTPRNRRGGRVPFQVEHGPLKVWAIAEDIRQDGAVLLLPHALPAGTALKIAVWGRSDSRACEIVRSETLKRAPFVMFRVDVRYVKKAAAEQDTVGLARSGLGQQAYGHEGHATGRS